MEDNKVVVMVVGMVMVLEVVVKEDAVDMAY